MPLHIATSHASITGLRAKNEDFVGMVTPNEPELSSKGLMAVVADGVSGSDGGRAAAEYSVRGLLADYYATPDTWEITTALEKVLVAINSWVQQQGSVNRTHQYAQKKLEKNTVDDTTEVVVAEGITAIGMATTLTSLVLRGRMYYTAHVGDSRAYHYRASRETTPLQRLTQDHVWDRPEMQHVLTRAIGLDSHLAIDHGMGELQVGDIFLLASDGFWGSFTDSEITAELAALSALPQPELPNDAALTLCQLAVAGGSQDNVSVVLLKVVGLPEGDLRDALSELTKLPVPARLKVGQSIDGLIVKEILHHSTTTVLYRVFDNKNQRQLVLKTLQSERGNDPMERSAFAHEAWLAKRVVARFFPQVVSCGERHFLYYLSTYHAGFSLQQKFDSGAHFTVPEIVTYGSKLVRAVGALHRRSIIHRDIKPANVHLGDDEEIRLLDLGVAQSGWEDAGTFTMAGTPSFLAPEQFSGASAKRQTDLYATGVTLYYLLTRHYPYGEVEPFQHPHFTTPTPASRYRPDVPQWLENVLLRAIARDPADRFETAEEFLLALERGATRPLQTARTTPLLKSDPARVWRSIALGSLAVNLLLFYFLVVG